jgi:hypothetical protein
MLPGSLVTSLKTHLEKVKALHEQDLQGGLARSICLLL